MDKKYYVHTIDTFTNKDVRVEVSKEVYETMNKSNRKERYFSEDLKREKIKVDQENETIKHVKSREDSLDRLLSENMKEFGCESTFENQIELRLQLADVFRRLKINELKLIDALYFKDLTEREYSIQSGIPQKTINNRKKAILRKMKNLL